MGAARKASHSYQTRQFDIGIDGADEVSCRAAPTRSPPACGITEPMGRASAIALCGHGDDTANDIGSLGPASCLEEWWFNN
jgi:hypothetical protein